MDKTQPEKPKDQKQAKQPVPEQGQAADDKKANEIVANARLAGVVPPGTTVTESNEVLGMPKSKDPREPGLALHPIDGTLEHRELRYRFACIALREIVRWQVENKKGGQEDVAASWAFRYADRMVDEARRKPSLPTRNVRGVAAEMPPVEGPIGTIERAPLEPLAEVT